MRRPRQLSIVPTMEVPPPVPLRLALVLIASSGAVGTGLALITLAIAPLVLALPGVTANAVVRVASAQSVVAWLTLLIATAVAVHRMRPIYDALARGSRVLNRGEPPPHAAIRAAFHAPERVVWGVTLAAQFIVLMEALGWISISGLTGWPRVALPLFAIAIACAGLHPSIMLWRAIVWRWLGRLHPDDVPSFAPRRLAHRLAFTATLPVGMVGLSAVVVLLSHLAAFHPRGAPAVLGAAPDAAWTDPTTPALAVVIALATTLATWFFVRRVGHRSATDLSRLTDEIERVQRRGRPSTRAQLAVFELIPRTAAGMALGRALAELAGRFSEIAEKEQQAGRAMEGVRHLRTQFLASMSHDLRSPLNAIVGFADLVASGAEGPLAEEQQESVQMIHRSARDLLRLVNHILDWARLDAGRFDIAPVRLEVGELLHEIVSEARAIVVDRHLGLYEEVPGDVADLRLYADRRRLIESLLAVLEHAASTMDEGNIELAARIHLSAEGRRELHITVRDEGPGIRPADAERAFQAFREIQDPSGKRVGGLGVGLAVAREVVRAHDGELTLTSRPGRGSTFRLVLPLPAARQPPPPRVKTLPPPPG